MKKDIVEFLDFDDDEKLKVGRPKLADKKTKKKALVISMVSFAFVALLLVGGYGTLVGFKNFNLKGSASNSKNVSNQNIKVTEIKPLLDSVTVKVGTTKKLYLTVLPAKASNKDIVYKSSDEKVAKIDKKGRVTGVSAGSTTITASTTDGSDLSTKFKVKVIKNVSGMCSFTDLNKHDKTIEYEIKCDNAVIKEVQYKAGGTFQSLTSKKTYGTVKLSDSQVNKNVILKVLYYPNNSKVVKYSTKFLNGNTTTTKQVKGKCSLDLEKVKEDSIRYNITCDNADVSKIAYKIGNGSYIGIDDSSLSSTVLYEKSDVTRAIYFSIEYTINGSDAIKTVSKSAVIPNVTVTTTKPVENNVTQ